MGAVTNSLGVGISFEIEDAREFATYSITVDNYRNMGITAEAASEVDITRPDKNLYLHNLLLH